jgi:hypothetical protein
VSEPLILPTGRPQIARGLSEISLVRDRLRRDLRALTLFLLPRLQNYQEDLGWIEVQTGLASDDIRELRRAFLRLGWWRMDSTGRAQVTEPRLGLGDGEPQSLTLPELFTLLPQVLGRLSESGPCWYTSQTVATNRRLKSRFYTEINNALERLLSDSEKEPADTLISWVHAGLDLRPDTDESQTEVNASEEPR